MNHEQIFEEMIRLELAMSDLYLQFHNLSTGDADFWWTLALEEKNHVFGKNRFQPAREGRSLQSGPQT